MRTFTLSLAVALCCAVMQAGPARAEERARLPFEASVGADYMSGGFNRTSFMRGGPAFTIRYDLTARLALHAGIGIGFMSMAFDHRPTAGLAARGALWSPVEGSGIIGVSYALLLGRKYRLDLGSDLETSLPGADLKMSRLRITTNDGNFDVSSFASDQLRPALFWRRLSLTAEFRAALGRFEPMLGVGISRLDAAIDLQLSQPADATLRSLGFSDGLIERRYAAAQASWLVPLRAGIGYRPCPENFYGIAAMYAPGGGPLYGVSAAYARSW